MGFLGDGETCVIEMAKASGLMLLKEDEKNPLIASTYGTGELILHALTMGSGNLLLELEEVRLMMVARGCCER